jgi:hypothetical protein
MEKYVIETLQDEHRQKKARYMAAKLGLIYLCDNCQEEIYLPERHPDRIYTADMPRWRHKKGGGSYDTVACWNDESDGIACPMNGYDLADYYEMIEKDDWWASDATEQE